MERVAGIEPAWPVWKTGTLPLSYTRSTWAAACGADPPASSRGAFRQCPDSDLENRIGRMPDTAPEAEGLRVRSPAPDADERAAPPESSSTGILRSDAGTGAVSRCAQQDKA